MSFARPVAPSPPQAAELRNPPKSLMLHTWPRTHLGPAVTQPYLLLTGSPPSRESPSSCSKRPSVPFCPFSKKSFPLGRMRGAGWTWRALPKAGYGLGTGSREPEVKYSFSAFPSSLPRATEKDREGDYQETISPGGFLHPTAYSAEKPSPPLPSAFSSFNQTTCTDHL